MAFLLFYLDGCSSPFSTIETFRWQNVSEITFLSLFLALKAIILTAYIFHYGEFFAAVYYSHRNVSIVFPVNYKH